MQIGLISDKLMNEQINSPTIESVHIKQNNKNQALWKI
jgi:hypothetical protein